MSLEALVRIAGTFAPMAAGMLLASVWQGVLLTAGVALALRGLRGVGAAARTWVWAAVLVLVLVLPGLVVMMPHPTVVGRGAWHVAQGWSVALLAVWVVFAGWRGWGLAVSAGRLAAVARQAVPVAVSAEVAELLAGPRRAVLCVSAEVNRPSVAGFWRPRVLLPAGLLETLSAAELEHVVLHEMEHLRRRDDWMNLLQQLSLVLLPLHPAVLWLDRRLCRERELACDDRVLEATRARRAYAACLVKLAEDSLLRKGFASALSALGASFRVGARESELVGRVRRILTAPEQASGGGRLTVGLLGMGALVAAGLLARSPEWVRFDGGAQVVMAGVRAPVTGARFEDVVNLPAARGGAMVPVVARGTALARPVLVKAVMPGPVVRKARRRMASRRLPVRVVAPQARMAAVRAGVVPGPRWVMTEFQVAQPLYAAVPWRDGWLIVQL